MLGAFVHRRVKSFWASTARATNRAFAQRTGVALAFVSLRPVVGSGPGAKLSAAVGPQMHRVAQVPVAMPANLGPPYFPAFETHRSRPGHTLQALRLRVLLPVAADPAQQPRRSLAPAPGRLPNKSWSGCWAKSFSIALRYSSSCFCNARSTCAVRTASRLLARGTASEPQNRSARSKISSLFGAVSGRHSLCVCRNFSHFRLPALTKLSGRRVGQHKLPRVGRGPVVKGLQRRRIVLVEGLWELVDQRRALRDQLHFIPAQ